MTFPDRAYHSLSTFVQDYAVQLGKALTNVDPVELDRAIEMIRETMDRDGVIHTCGNGGSAAIANHLVCDFVKGTRVDTDLRLRVNSLTCNVPLITALANDFDYDEIFVFQLEAMARPGDMILTISSSGDSENIVRAVTWGRNGGYPVLSMTGFSGGRSARDADVNLHVNAENYGVIEDAHEALMHCIAQFARLSRMDKHLLRTRTF
jgi:D-sedoheptulose 7-phosphate isomerase